jgi:CheY-like chemotaxis protein
VLPVSPVYSDDTAIRQKPTLAADPLETIPLPRLDSVEILVVDDESDGRALIGRILEGQGARTVGASSAHEALQLLASQRFDVLLSDIGMPGVDGYALIRQVRLLDSSRSGPIPAIAVTAYARPEDRQRSLLAGYNMHLSKPIEAPELIASIASLLRLSG